MWPPTASPSPPHPYLPLKKNETYCELRIVKSLGQVPIHSNNVS